MTDDNASAPEPEILGHGEPLDLPPAGPTAYHSGPVTDILATTPATRGRSRRPWVAAGAGVVAVALVGAGAAFAAGAFRSAGAQPESFVPASAVGFVSLDLDPSLGQKVDALRFLRAFPSAKQSLGGTDDLRQWAFEQLAKDDPDLSSLHYATDVKPWLGDRFAVAALPAPQAGSAPTPLVVVQVSDEGKATAGLKRLMSKPGDGTCSVSDGYAVCARDAAVLRSARAAVAQHSLADDAHFRADVHALGQRGIALGWGDLAKLGALAPAAGGSRLGVLGSASGSVTGRFVAALRFNGANLELQGRTTGVKATASLVGSHGTGVEALPDGTLAAVGVANDPAATAKAFGSVTKGLAAAGGAGSANGLNLWSGIQQELAAQGLHLPQDLNALLGTRFAVAFAGISADGTPQVGVRSDAAPAPAGKVLDKLSAVLASSGTPFVLHHTVAGHGYAAALSQSYARQLATGGGLGRQPSFVAAVPDAGSATFVLYADIARLLSSGGIPGLGAGPVDPNLKALSAVGISGRQDADGSATFDIRVITR